MIDMKQATGNHCRVVSGYLGDEIHIHKRQKQNFKSQRYETTLT